MTHDLRGEDAWMLYDERQQKKFALHALFTEVRKKSFIDIIQCLH